MIQEYKSLVEAARDLEAIKAELSREDGTYTSPAWRMVYHAQEHITKLATECLHGCDVRS
jgi:hypothetical protein